MMLREKDGRKKITDKFKKVSEMIDVMLDFVIEQDECCPSINMIANEIAESNLLPDTSDHIRSLVLKDVTEYVTRYFSDACELVADDLGDAPWHYVTRKFYSAKYRTPLTELEATKYVAAFGVGRTDRVHGVRFLNDYNEAKADHMYAVYVAKRANVDDGKISKTADRIIAGLRNGTLTHINVFKLPKGTREAVEAHPDFSKYLLENDSGDDDDS